MPIVHCIASGCDKPSRARRLCWAHYRKQLRAESGARSRVLGADPRVRIAARVQVTESDCWQWIGTLDRDGYGVLEFESKRHRAHRLSYESHVGPIPDGLTIDHLCRNAGCVNPAHLEPVTNEENARRAASARLAAKESTDG